MVVVCLRRVYCVSIVPSVQYGIWCLFDTRGNGVRVVVFYIYLSVNPVDLGCDIRSAGVFHYSRYS